MGVHRPAYSGLIFFSNTGTRIEVSESEMAAEGERNIAQEIRGAREKENLSRKELADRAGCSEDYLEWIEEGHVVPPVALLIQLAKALRLDAVAFLHARETPGEQRLEEASKRTEHYSYQTLTPPEADKHLMAFSVMIPPKTAHEGVGYQHEGEEFVYVVSGEVDLVVGRQKIPLSQNQSFRFNSSLDHHLSNPGDRKTELLVVLYVP